MNRSPRTAKASAPAEARRARRDLVDFGAPATNASGIHDIRIVNISPLGLMGRVPTTLVAGERLMFDLPHVRRVESVVRWVEDGRIGVEFVRAIPADHYAMMLAFMPQRKTRW
ncbi:hypothetical protein BH11PSE5_BH11PSE5_32490 [soil metagenome]|uniref:PilZ domain-containing protein n=1 Tax=unclassified Sphingobium TaxID=2611147 RepID=UPI001E4E36B1|nr:MULTISPECIES: PilZ domain-containing protein [unclassified Sphingobium]